MLRKIFDFYFSSKGVISQRDYILKVVLPGIVILGLVFVLIRLRLPVVIITWPVIIFTLISLALGNPLERKRDRDAGNSERAQDRFWLHKLIALALVILGFTLSAATLWALPIMLAGLAYAVIIYALRAKALLSPSKRRF